MILLKTHNTSNVWFWFSYWCCSFCICPLLHPSMCEDYSGSHTDVALSASARYCLPQCVRIILVLILMLLFQYLPVSASLNVWGLFWFSYWCGSFCFCPLVHPSMCEDYSGSHTDVALSASARYCIPKCVRIILVLILMWLFLFLPVSASLEVWGLFSSHTDVALSVSARYCIPKCVRIILVLILMWLFLFLPVTASQNVWGFFGFSYWCGSFCFCPLLHPKMCEDYSGSHTDVALSVSARYCIPQCVRIIADVCTW